MSYGVNAMDAGAVIKDVDAGRLPRCITAVSLELRSDAYSSKIVCCSQVHPPQT